jgi:hypothetical protein
VSAPASAQQQVWSETGGLASDALGVSTTFVPDCDGDGVADLLVGAPGGMSGVVGKAKLFSGATRTLLREFSGDTPNDQFGAIVDDLGDVDGDGVRDFAIAAPARVDPGAPLGAIFFMSGATGTAIRAIRSSVGYGFVGNSLVTIGDVDGDGVRDVVYDDWTGPNYTVFVVSGRTAATIRTHTGGDFLYGFAVGRVGDVDGDGVDDYTISESSKVSVHSGATGALIQSIARYAPVVRAAGDVDLDGHADLLLFDHNSGPVHVHSGATGALLYDLAPPSPFPGWSAASAAGDLDGDGHSDVVAASFDHLDVFSGATGAKLFDYMVSDSGAIRSLDATADVDGDGVADLAAADPLVPGPNGLARGRVFLVSGADGSTVATIDGSAFVSELASSCTLVGDRDGDGWRDVALAVPGGLDDTSPNLVQVVSGRDGHELSRFQTASGMSDQDRQLVAIGDVDGDGVADLAVACPWGPTGSPPTNVVELHSGADDSLITTLVPPVGSPSRLAAAADGNGTPLLAVSTLDSLAGSNVLVYDLTSDGVVTTYAGNGSFDLACVGDVNGDGVVDWVVRDPRHGLGGAVNVFAGGASPKTLWSVVGTASNPVTGAASAGDLDGDGLDDVLVAFTEDSSETGKVTAFSGQSGAKLFELKGSQTFEGFGSSLAPLGDVNRDGVADFAIGARTYGGLPGDGALFVYSGKTVSLLHRFDNADTDHFGEFGALTLPNQRWHDDPRVDPDRTPDVVLGLPTLGFDRGHVELHRLDDLMLQVDPPIAPAGSSVTATTRGGPPGNLVGLYAVDLSGTPLDYFLALGTFNPKGNFVVTEVVPSSMQGLTLDVISYGVGFNGKLVDSETTAIEVQ